MTFTFDPENGTIMVDGIVCWFMQREHPHGEPPNYHMRAHVAAERLPLCLRDTVRDVFNNPTETKRGCLSSMKRVHQELVKLYGEIS